MPRLKAVWTVQAGVIPGTVEKEHSKMWNYTDDDYEADMLAAKDGSPSNIFTERMKDATAYMMQMNDPRYLNWARLEFMWL